MNLTLESVLERLQTIQGNPPAKPVVTMPPEPIWNGGTLESGSCIQCKQPTSSMITTPGGLIGWCCLSCFDKRAVKHD